MLGHGKDKEERRLKKAKISIMRNPKFALLSGLMTVGKTRVEEDVPTAVTNGRDEAYGRAFIKSLDDKELAFVVMHETMHKMYRHLFVWKKLWDENPQLANMACDYVINIQLVDMDERQQWIAMPMKAGKTIGLVDPRFRGMHAKQVFDILKEEKKDEGGSGGGAGDNDGKGGLDAHDWEGAKELSDEAKKLLERDIDSAIRQGLIAERKVAGAGAGGLARELQELLEPEVNWREVLREFVTTTCAAKDASSWRRVNRRYLASDIYMPSLIGEKVGHLCIGVDTSGSIGGQELADFMSEVKSIAEDVHPDRVDLMYWDGEVAGHEEYDAATVPNIVSSTQPKGGGGTDPRCVHTFMQKKNIKPQALVMLTDGCIGDWGNEWDIPVLWVIAGNAGTTAPMGKTIHIKNN